jgi:poly(3-hydroxybutyrate) depolymerase
MLRGCLLVILLVTVGVTLAQRKLPKYNVDHSAISTSGTSSGGCFATQLHVIYSKTFMGVGVVAGAPYYCAKGSALTATNACATTYSNINVNDLIAQTGRYANAGDVDQTFNMQNDRVFIYTGTRDSTVVSGVVNKVADYYRNYVNSANIKLVNFDGAEHAFPTLNYGNACSVKASPYISRCNYDGAYEILSHIYPGITRPTGTVPLNGDFYEFDQSEFFYISPPILSSMDNTGYVYVPSGCVNNQNKCKLHVSFHGCQQGRHRLGNEYATKTGYNEVGELNNIIILYPQATAYGSNPYGCWDWWGYTVNFYATNRANQPLAVIRMVEQIS